MFTELAEDGCQVSAAADPSKPSYWYALHVRARHEKKISSVLQKKGFEAYVPAMTQVHRWSDRKMQVEVPLFPCYLFVRVPSVEDVVVALFQYGGFIRVVGDKGKGTPIPDRQIEEVQQLIDRKLPLSEIPYLKAGQRVRVVGGPLDGVQGILTDQKRGRHLVISVDAIQKSLAVCVEGYNIRPA